MCYNKGTKKNKTNNEREKVNKMITAKEAKGFKELAELAKIEAKRTIATEYCEELSKRIEERAKDGYSAIEVNDYPIEAKSYVIAELQNNGFQVQATMKDRLFIAWF